VITLEGLEVKGRQISRRHLVSVWKTLSNEPFPKVRAFEVEDKDFERIIKLRKCWGDVKRELIEWGRTLTVRGTDACVFNAGGSADCDYIILIRTNPYHSFEEILKHELRHIAKGDL
jgi:hypothetical protein